MTSAFDTEVLHNWIDKDREHLKAEKEFKIRTKILKIFVPIISTVPPLVVHSLNPCVTYATTLFWCVTGVFILVVILTWIATILYTDFSYFCDRGLIFEHFMDITGMFFIMNSCLGYYDLYTYLPSDGGVYAVLGCIVQFITAFGLIWIAFVEKHRHDCTKQDEKVYVYGSKCWFQVFNAAYYLALIAWAAIFGLAAGFDWQLWASNSGRDPELCFEN